MGIKALVIRDSAAQTIDNSSHSPSEQGIRYQMIDWGLQFGEVIAKDSGEGMCIDPDIKEHPADEAERKQQIQNADIASPAITDINVHCFVRHRPSAFCVTSRAGFHP